MNMKSDIGYSVWAGADKDAPAHLVPVSPPKVIEVNGAPLSNSLTNL
jgi:hypothetical protein